MSIRKRRREILQAMGAITRMERGKLCTQSRGPSSPAFHKLQWWHRGKNLTRYVASGEVLALREALDGYQKFRELVDEFVELTVAWTREQSETKAKKISRKSKPKVIHKPRPP